MAEEFRNEYNILGRPVAKKDSWLKVSGQAEYADDIFLPGMLHGKLLRSPHPHAKILHIDASKAAALPGVRAIVTGKDFPGIKYGNIPQTRDYLPLAIDRVRYIGEEVAAVAAIDEDTAEEALDLIEVEYEPLPAVFDPEAAMQPGAPQLHEHAAGNIPAIALSTSATLRPVSPIPITFARTCSRLSRSSTACWSLTPASAPGTTPARSRCEPAR